MPLELFTTGHSTHALVEFVDLLGRHDIKLVADIGRFPGSRKWPHFNREPSAKPEDEKREDAPKIKSDKIETKRIGDREPSISFVKRSGVGHRCEDQSDQRPDCDKEDR